MLLSTRGRYALRIMIDLVESQGDKGVPLREIASRQQVSEKYLENIIRPLSKSGVLNAERGKGGGYSLSRRPEEYSVGEILRLVGGYHYVVSCLSKVPNPCERAPTCKTLPMWQDLQSRMDKYFNQITIADLASGTFDFSSIEI